MTLILCSLAATLTWGLRWRLGANSKLGTLALMYTAASLMWCVDGIANLVEGAPFVELSDVTAMSDDALLGTLVVAAGALVWGLIKGK